VGSEISARHSGRSSITLTHILVDAEQHPRLRPNERASCESAADGSFDREFRRRDRIESDCSQISHFLSMIFSGASASLEA
jgi:hypothetical protein